MSSKVPQPEVQVIKLHKNSNGMGLSIVAAKGAGQVIVEFVYFWILAILMFQSNVLGAPGYLHQIGGARRRCRCG